MEVSNNFTLPALTKAPSSQLLHNHRDMLSYLISPRPSPSDNPDWDFYVKAPTSGSLRLRTRLNAVQTPGAPHQGPFCHQPVFTHSQGFIIITNSYQQTVA